MTDPPLHPAVPYLVVLALAAVAVLFVGAYVVMHRDEIIWIITQSPT